MITQVELFRENERAVYWLPVTDKLKVGKGVNLLNSGWWTIGQVLVTLKDGAQLPPKARLGTIVELN